MEDILFDFYTLFASYDLVADLYQDQALTGFFLIMVGICLIFPAVFYKVLDHPNYRKTSHWLLFMFFNFLSVTGFYLIALYAKRNKENLSAGTEEVKLYDFDWTVFLTFSLEMAVLGTLFYIFFSLAVFKYFSTNCNNTPF